MVRLWYVYMILNVGKYYFQTILYNIQWMIQLTKIFLIACISQKIMTILVSTINLKIQTAYSNLHCNIWSFRSNYDEFSVSLTSLVVQPTIIILSETWFNNDYIDQINGYNGFHSHRVGRGGGISVFVMATLKAYSPDKEPDFTNWR